MSTYLCDLYKKTAPQALHGEELTDYLAWLARPMGVSPHSYMGHLIAKVREAVETNRMNEAVRQTQMNRRLAQWCTSRTPTRW